MKEIALQIKSLYESIMVDRQQLIDLLSNQVLESKLHTWYLGIMIVLLLIQLIILYKELKFYKTKYAMLREEIRADIKSIYKH